MVEGEKLHKQVKGFLDNMISLFGAKRDAYRKGNSAGQRKTVKKYKGGGSTRSWIGKFDGKVHGSGTRANGQKFIF